MSEARLQELEYFKDSLWGKAIPPTQTRTITVHDKLYTFNYIDLLPCKKTTQTGPLSLLLNRNELIVRKDYSDALDRILRRFHDLIHSGKSDPLRGISIIGQPGIGAPCSFEDPGHSYTV
jgi:hypothetical protein